MATSEIGKLGEDLAAQNLISKGCKIITRNYRQKFGEIDIVAKAKDGLLLFIEVKTKVAERGAEMKPEDNMTLDKIRKFKKIAEFYALRYPELVGERGWRADVAAVYLFPEYLTPHLCENMGSEHPSRKGAGLTPHLWRSVSGLRAYESTVKPSDTFHNYSYLSQCSSQGAGLTKLKNNFAINYYENIF